MLKYIVKRILQMIPMMIILSIVVFCMVRLIPGDPVTMSLGMGAGKEAIAAETARLGLDKPLWQQYTLTSHSKGHRRDDRSLYCRPCWSSR